MIINKRRIPGFIVTVLVAALAAYFTVRYPHDSGLKLVYDQGHPDVPSEPGTVSGEDFSLKALYRTINLVHKHYIDPARFDASAMLVAGLRALEVQVAKLMVSETGEHLRVRVGDKQAEYRLTDISSPWILLKRTKAIFSFLRDTLGNDSIDYQELEYDLINGMLRTLDPHSVLLTPDYFREMRDKTQGQFGGLGIVISLRDGVLTVISPIDGTPADLAGLEAGDQIIRIGEASTINMSLNSAVGLLRGAPGTAVTVHILRKGWEEPRPFEIVRAIIQVQSIESHRLKGDVGYIWIKDFQGNTSAHLHEHLGRLEEKNIKGLVLDLRNNPGGLLESAIQVSDRFLASGAIVTTAGQGPDERDVRRAKKRGVEPDYPIVVIVNAGSASASEIVAGALKNHDRALVIGRRTFGKGSVQQLYDFNDGSALKLTTGQYLTPGDISIQSVGIVPDIEILPTRADDEWVDLQVDPGYHESDLDRHFSKGGGNTTPIVTKPRFSLGYLWTPPSDRLDRPTHPARKKTPSVDGKKFDPDFEINLARETILEMLRATDESSKIDRINNLVRRSKKTEEKRITKALDTLGINWKLAGPPSETRLTTSAALTQPGPIKAGEPGKVNVTLANEGASTLSRVLVQTRSDFRPLDDQELPFGRIAPGESVTKTLEFKIPADSLSRVDDVLLTISDAYESDFQPMALRIDVEALDRPVFAYAYQIVDTEKGNGDGTLQRGETADIIVDVENTGVGAALDTYLTLKNLSGNEIFMLAGRSSLEKLHPNERKRAIFSFEVKQGFDRDTAEFELAIADMDLRVYNTEKIEVPIQESRQLQEFASELTTAAPSTPIREYPSPQARIVANVPQNRSLTVDAQTELYYRCRIDENRTGFIAKAALRPSPGDEQLPIEIVVNAPPRIDLGDVGRVVRSESVVLSGRAIDKERIRSIYVFVGDEKVFFKPGHRTTERGQLAFETEIPLDYGLNYVTIVAEESADFDSRQTITIRRDRADGMPYLASRKSQADPEPLGVHLTEQTPAPADSPRMPL